MKSIDDEVELLRDALDHIARIATATDQSTRRLDWIAARARQACRGIPWSKDYHPEPKKQSMEEYRDLLRSIRMLVSACESANLTAITAAVDEIRNRHPSLFRPGGNGASVSEAQPSRGQTMNKRRQKGWLMVLKHSDESEWGDIEKFYKDIDSAMGLQSALDFGSGVWGKLHRKDLMPMPGDGIGFYHATRARFPKPDLYKRSARISLVGEILNIEQNGQKIDGFSVRILRTDFESLRRRPILRNEKTEHLFQDCGMVQGVIATYFEVPPDTWAKFLALARRTDDSL